MLRFTTMHRPTTVEDAVALKNKFKTAPFVGGGLWLRLGDRRWPMVIDIAGLGLNEITETDTEYVVGAMVTQRDMELYGPFQTLAGGAIPKSLHSIIGVQFRNMATIGGSVAAKFGFSDILPTLLALHADVTLAEQGRMPLATFMTGAKKDLLLSVHIPKKQGVVCLETLRKSAADFPILTVAIRKEETALEIYVGGRPGPARLAVKASEAGTVALQNGRTWDAALLDELGTLVAEEMDFQTNTHASATYRREMAKALVAQVLREVNNGR